VSTASGFNTHGWEAWKARGGKRTRETFFMDGMFVLHNKNFKTRVPASSVTCPVVESSGANISKFVKRQGVYMISSTGICDMDDGLCRKEHFGGDPDCKLNAPQAKKQPLELMSRKGIEMRKLMMLSEKEKKGKGPKIPARAVQYDNLRCAGQKPTGLSESELWCYAARYPNELGGMDADALNKHWLGTGQAEGRVAGCPQHGMRIPHPVDGLGAFDPWAQTEEEDEDEDKDEGAAGGSEEDGGAYTFTDPSTGEKFSTLEKGGNRKSATGSREKESARKEEAEAAAGSSSSSSNNDESANRGKGKGSEASQTNRQKAIARASKVKNKASSSNGNKANTNSSKAAAGLRASKKRNKLQPTHPIYMEAAARAARGPPKNGKSEKEKVETVVEEKQQEEQQQPAVSESEVQGEAQLSKLIFSSDELEGLLATQPSASELARQARAEGESEQAAALAAAAEAEGDASSAAAR
jgi:hypothetical protein